MSADDFDVVEYKVLAYLYQCIKDGVRPNQAKAEEVAKINQVYWEAVISDLVDRGMVKANVLRGIDSTMYGDLRITSAGVEYLDESPRMKRVKKFLGTAFDVALKVAVEATKAI